MEVHANYSFQKPKLLASMVHTPSLLHSLAAQTLFLLLIIILLSTVLPKTTPCSHIVQAMATSASQLGNFLCDATPSGLQTHTHLLLGTPSALVVQLNSF